MRGVAVVTLQLKPLAEQVMLITGASSGIGLVTARRAAAEGARVVLVARNEHALRDAVAGIEAEGGAAAYAVADVGDAAQVRRAAEVAISRFGQLDTWVNCAGVAIYAKLVDTPEEEHERLFRTNYFGLVHGALAAIAHLRERGGALITIGSIAGDIPSPIMGAYAASKHAARGYIESLQIELAAERAPISVTLIKPGGIDTPIAEHAANHLEGEARIPPPIYDATLVADAILRAAVRPIRAVTVGGIGRLQVILGSLFPGMLARFGGLLIPLLSDPDIPKTPGDNLSAPAADGEERSTHETGRAFSLYGALTPARITAIGAGALAIAFLAKRRGSRER